MRIGNKEMSEPEVNALVNEMKTLLKIANKELGVFAYGNCGICVHKGHCEDVENCNYRWEYADRVERLLT